MESHRDSSVRVLQPRELLTIEPNALAGVLMASTRNSCYIASNIPKHLAREWKLIYNRVGEFMEHATHLLLCCDPRTEGPARAVVNTGR